MYLLSHQHTPPTSATYNHNFVWQIIQKKKRNTREKQKKLFTDFKFLQKSENERIYLLHTDIYGLICLLSDSFL